jgi:hypothetical protein
MSKRASLTLVFVPAVLFGLLLFLSQTMSVSGSGLESRAFSSSGSLDYEPYLGPGDSITEAIPIYVNVAQVGQIDSLTKTIYYRLDLSAGDINRQFRVSVVEISPDQGTYRFELSLYDADGDFMFSEDTTGGDADLDWPATLDTYYFGVTAIELADPPSPVSYEILVIRLDATFTPTNTPAPDPWDDCEINDDMNGTWSDDTPPGGPYQLSVGVERTDLNFMPYTGQPVPNDDYFTFLAKAGRIYRITTEVGDGADTAMWLYDPSNTEIAYDDDGGDGLGSRIERTLNDGWYKILVRDRLGSTSPTTSQTYDIIVEDVSPETPTPTSTPTPGTGTPTPTPLSIPGKPDAFEPNYTFGRASLIGLGTKYTNLNFVPWSGTEADNDFYKLWVVAGKLYTCETSDLGTATNTNMILYSGPSFEQGFAGNDDVKPFDADDPYRSYIQFFSSYDGYVYILLGQVGAAQILPEEWKNLSYSLQCYIDQPGTATPTPTSEFVPPTPRPTATPAEATPEPSPTPARLEVKRMTTPTPPSTPVPVVTPTPGLFTIKVSLYYDRNGNGQADPDEGVSAVLARAYDAISGELLSVDYTDETGNLRFIVSARGPVRVSVPYFGFNQVVTATDTDIQIRISPRS